MTGCWCQLTLLSKIHSHTRRLFTVALADFSHSHNMTHLGDAFSQQKEKEDEAGREENKARLRGHTACHRLFADMHSPELYIRVSAHRITIVILREENKRRLVFMKIFAAFQCTKWRKRRKFDCPKYAGIQLP
jgi:hypothetical protein